MTEQGVVPYKPAHGLEANLALPVVKLHDVLEELGMAGPVTPAEELVGRTFQIRKAKPFASRFDDEAHAYYCVCVDPATGEKFATVLGGMAVVEILDAYIAAGQKSPLEVTLGHNEGGRFEGYYTLE